MTQIFALITMQYATKKFTQGDLFQTITVICSQNKISTYTQQPFQKAIH